MATILAVHGTFASGEEKGERWWQKGSPFESHLRELVEAESGDLCWQPVVWDGLNSETSRRAAGVKLSKAMMALEERHEPYCAIGHSHGGSVISAALLECANRKKGLDHLGWWLTIGTPFIRTKRHRLLFSRLGTGGKSIYAGLIVGGVVSVIGLMLEFMGEAFEFAGFGFPVGGLILNMLILTAANVTLPLLLLYFLILYSQRKYYLGHRAGIVALTDRMFKSKWLSLRHSNDEAVQGLRSLRTIGFDIFSEGFAASAISLFLLMLMFTAFISFLLWPSAMRSFLGLVHEPYLDKSWVKYVLFKDDKLIGDGHNFGVNALLVAHVVTALLGSLIGPIAQLIDPLLAVFGTQYSWKIRMFVSTLIFLSVVALFASVLVVAVQLLAKAFSFLLSKVLNPVARSQIKAAGFGSDTQIDTAVDTQDFPMWLKNGMPPLPDALSQEIEAVSDASAAKAVQQFRGALGSLTLAKGPGATADLLSKYLTGDELIHTTYFKVARFRKLVAYSLTQSEGFRATPAFLQDADYELVAGWYREIVADRTKSENPSA